MSDFTQTIPHDSTAEKGVLASILLAPVAVLSLCASACITARSFYIPAHALIFETIAEAHGSSKPLDFIVLASALRDAGKLDQIGGPAALNELYVFLPTAANASHYIEIVAKAALARRAYALGEKLRNAAFEGNGDPAEALAEAQQEIVAMLTRNRAGAKTTKEIIREICFEVINGKNNSDVLPTGIAGMDALLQLNRSDYLVIPGPTSSGKSALAAQICIAMAKQGARVLYVPLEMSAKQVLTRAIASESGWNAERVRGITIAASRQNNPALDKDAREAQVKFSEGAYKIANLDLTVRDDITDLDGILAMSRAHAAEKPLDVLCVDYPALMSMRGTFERRQLALAHASQSFKRFASEIRGLVITPSQVNKDGGTREAADFENDANAILAVSFDPDNESKRIVRIAKQRDGERGQALPLEWHGSTTCFHDTTKPNPLQ